jgi:hypothetical protein
MNDDAKQMYAQGYQVGYEQGLKAAQQPDGGNNGGGHSGGTTHPFSLGASYSEKSSRLLMFFMFFKGFLLIPHLFCLWALGIATAFVIFAAWWVVVITGQYPKSMWDFVVGVQQWQMRVSSYWLGLTDVYPPFTLS